MSQAIDRRAFKDCDVRGVYPDELDEALFEKVGWAYGQALAAAPAGDLTPGLVVVGGDARASTPTLRESFLAGLSAHPLTVVDLGVGVPTPAIYWAKAQRRAQGSAIITASHNPPSWNGLKLMAGPLPPKPEDILGLADAASSFPTRPGLRRARVTRWNDVVRDYLAALAARFCDRGIERLTVAVDPGNGCLSGVASKAFRDLGARVVPLHDTIDGLFRERHPDCAVPAHLEALCAAAADAEADFGVAFDGDGDRIAVVDGRGRVLGAERLAMILFQGPLRPSPGDRVILDVKCSMHLDRRIAALGGEAIRCKSGHAFMKRTVLERQALAGVELSGHVFLGEIEARDDPTYTSLLLAAWLAGQGADLAELVDSLPRMYMTEDLRLALPPDEIERVIATCAEGLGGGVPERLDGVRLVWPDGWLLARRSITEPKITMRLEGETPEALRRIAAVCKEAFPTLAAPLSTAVDGALSAHQR